MRQKIHSTNVGLYSVNGKMTRKTKSGYLLRDSLTPRTPISKMYASKSCHLVFTPLCTLLNLKSGLECGLL